VNWLEDQGFGGMYRGHGLGGNEVYPAVSAVPEPFTHTHWIVDESIKFLSQRDPDQPFFLWIVFEAPHSPFDPPEPYDRMYDHVTIPEPIYADWYGMVDAPLVLQKIRLSHKYDQLTDEIIRETRRRYYGQITHLDYQLGRFLGELKSKDLYDNTVIVFTSDHGEHLGDHGLFAKSTFLRGSADVPLIIRFPPDFPIARPALEIDAPALTADICPTLLGLADLEPGPDTDGVSLLPVVQSGQASEDRLIFGESTLSAFATDGRHKYIYYPEGGVEQLFDVTHDPYDLTNLAATDQHRAIRADLRGRLTDHLSRFNRPMVDHGDLICLEPQLDEAAWRAQNPMAWRGPLRYGQGY
jgi:arylsulfatase A-like enzyme